MAMLRRGRSLKISHVEFTGGEPTLHPKLLLFISSARSMGYGVIGISSNGRRLAYPSYMRELAAAGINYAVISVPAADRKTYVKIAGAPPAAFIETLTGLKNAADSGGIEVGASVPVTRDNAGSLREIIRMLDGFKLSHITLSRPLSGFPGAALPAGLPGREGFVAAVRSVWKDFSAMHTRVFVEDFSGDFDFLPGGHLIRELRRNRYLYADAVAKKQFLMPDAVLAAERSSGRKKKAPESFRAAIDLQYGPSDFTCGFDSRVIHGRPYHRLVNEKLDFDCDSPVLKRFLSVVNREKTIDIWGRDRADRFPKLKGLAKLCGKSGFKRVRLWTTGLGLDSDAKLDRLRSFGVTALEIPIYGAGPEIHDAVTGLGGSYRELRGVLSRLARRADFEVSLHSVALKGNIHDLPAICGLVNGYSRAWKFAIWHYYPDYQSPAAKKSYLAALPSYDRVIEAFRKNPADGQADFVLFPECVVRRLGRVFKGANFFAQAPEARLLVCRDGLFHFKKINSADEFGRRKAPPCSACADSGRCPGFFPEYLDKYGHKSIG